MTFERKTWADGEAGGTPITAAQLNRIEAGVAGPHDRLADTAAAEHTHVAADITAGTFTVARIPQLSPSKITGLPAALDLIDDLATRLAALEAAAGG